MAAEYPYLYPYSRPDAVRMHEEDRWQDSFRENVCCARAIEKALRQDLEDDRHIAPDCVTPVLEEYGHKRVGYVLAHTIRDLEKILLTGIWFKMIYAIGRGASA